MNSKLNQLATITVLIDAVNRISDKRKIEGEVEWLVRAATQLVKDITSADNINPRTAIVDEGPIENKPLSLPAQHQIGNMVDLDFGNSRYMSGCIVKGIHFTPDHVYYDIDVPLEFDTFVTLYDVDSIVVVKHADNM